MLTLFLDSFIDKCGGVYIFLFFFFPSILMHRIGITTN